MNQSSFSFTYKGRKTAWYILQRVAILLLKGEAWFRVNFTDERTRTLIDVMEAAGQIIDLSGSGTIVIKDGKVESAIGIAGIE
jgi:hypothetical protein